jgi:PadR family transcriptional regulator, regulatory protein AphA
LQQIRLTPTSYIVLGLLGQTGPATPYELKGTVAAGIGNFWSVQHTQLYAEPERLTQAGLLTETREPGGRRRKLYELTPAGRAALVAWLAGQPGGDLPELRDESLLRVFFGAEPGPIARIQLQAHRAKLAEYQEIEQVLSAEGVTGPLIALRAGIGHEREWIRFWADLTGPG